MKEFPKYGDTENLHRGQEVLEYAVVVTEKLHGTNTRFVYLEKHGLVVGSRNNTVYKDGQKSAEDGYNFSGWLLDRPELVEAVKKYPGYVVYGEFHGPGIQKGVTYSEEKDFRVFEVRDPNGEFMDWADTVRITEDLGLKTVPVLLEGRVTVDDLDQLMDKNSQTAVDNGLELEDNVAEGVCIKPLKATRDRRGNWIRTKYKSEKWAENAKAPKTRRADPETAELQARAREFAEMVVTPGRVATVVDHITRDGNVDLHLGRTGDFLRAFIQDVMKEHEDVYDGLEKKEQNTYNKVVNSQAVPLWKDYLMG